ncbi:MAG TPA: universal stress protein, partial [Agromyces sp.]
MSAAEHLRIVVGYTADESGADALALGARIAGATEAFLEVVMVLPIEARGGVVPRDPGYERHVKARSQGWLAEASATLGDDVAQS